MSGWTLVAKGLHLVAADGASRVASAVASSNVATKHLPELAASVRNAAATQAANVAPPPPSSGAFESSTARFGSADGSKRSTNDSAALNGMEGVRLHRRMEDGLDRRLDSIPIDKSAPVHDSLETSGESDSKASAMQPSYIKDNNKASESQTEATSDRPRESHDEEHRTPHLPEGTAVPSTRLSRALGFASLGAGLAAGAAAELARRALGASSSDGSPLVSNDANARRLSESLRRMRGAAMKLGQMLSIQDESIAPPALTGALESVRKGAEAMPREQLSAQLEDQWGEGWRERIEVEDRPFAAASIGQVHRGALPDGARVAVKVQYPGVADSIESDLSNLSMLIKSTGLAPPGLFLENVIRVGRDELKAECDYQREAENQQRFRELISSDPGLVADKFVVPKVMDEMSTSRILVTELVHGGTIDKVANLHQSERDRIGKAIMRLTMLELFVWRFMQTDPNWGNFLYDVRTRTTYPIDFGAAREYDEDFVRGYLGIVVANADRDEARLMEESIRMGFLTGEEGHEMLEAHKLSGFCLGEPFRSYEPYDFRASKITTRISEHGSVFLKHRLTPPPEEVYTLHRKLAGAYNLCIKLGAKISCRDLLDEVLEHEKNRKWLGNKSTHKA